MKYRLQETDQHYFSLGQSLIQLVASFVIYLALGALGMSFAIANGYSSPIFPAAGFAVATMLWTKGRAWPAIWAASFALNLGTSWLRSELIAQTYLIAACIAVGSTVQAIVARRLITRFMGDGWKSLEKEKDVFICLALGGPIACLVSSNSGVFVLSHFGVIPPGETFYATLNWWLGDMLGVWLALPMTLVLLFGKSEQWRQRLTVVVLPILVGAGLVIAAHKFVADWEQQNVSQKIRAHGEILAQDLRQRLIAHQEALAALQRLFEVSPDMTHDNFEYFTRITLADNPDIFALSINPFITQSARENFERAQSKMFAGFEIKEHDTHGGLVRAKIRPDYVAVGYIAPLKVNRPALGFDISSDAVRRAAIERATKSTLHAVTGPIQLVQEKMKHVGVLVLYPAYQQAALENQTHTTKRLIGYAVGVFKVDELAEIATRSANVDGLEFQLLDPLADGDSQVLYSSQKSLHSSHQEREWLTGIQVADRQWQLRVYPTHAYLQQERQWTALLVGCSGLTLIALLQILLLGTTGRTFVVQRIVRSQTQELRDKSGALEERNAQLDALFALSPDGFVAIGQKGTIKFVNPAFQRMTGIAVNDMVGHTVSELDAALGMRLEPNSKFFGVMHCIPETGATLPALVLNLTYQGNKVLHVMGMRSASSRIASILYLRDITTETEVDRMKSEFLSTAAHELRTPMASVFGFAEVLLTQESSPDEQKEMLEIIFKQSGLMANILNELLDLARIEARQGKDFVIQKISLQDLVRDAVSGFKLPPNRQAPVVTMPAEAQWVDADRNKVRQAIVNLLSNAYKYSPKGGAVEIEFMASASQTDRCMLGLSVTDHGIGMTAAQTERIFERFYRADTSGNIPGTGLGMSIVKEIIELHGGEVRVESTPAIGTRITLWFPQARA